MKEPGVEFKSYSVAVVGAGPSGIACALQLKKYGINFVVFEKDKPGGLVQEASMVTNYPGYPEGISGRELSALMYDQLNQAGVEIILEEVVDVRMDDWKFLIETSKGRYVVQMLVVASGTVPRSVDGVEIDCLSGWCCPHYSVRELDSASGGRVAIIGGGDVAFDYAVGLALRGVSVVILVRDDRPKCNRELLVKVKEKSDLIQVITGANVRRMSCREGSCAVTYFTGEGHHRLEADHLLCAIGRLPALDFLGESVRERLEELVEEERLFLIGDVGSGHFRQAVIAAGDGVRAAMRIASLVEGKSGEEFEEGF